jgi:hypothetical protein
MTKNGCSGLLLLTAKKKNYIDNLGGSNALLLVDPTVLSPFAPQIYTLARKHDPSDNGKSTARH